MMDMNFILLIRYLIEMFMDGEYIRKKKTLCLIVAAITSRACSKVKLPTHTNVMDFKGLDKESVILLEQIRTLDKQRLTKYMGMLPCSTMARVDKALAISISLSIPPEEKCVKRQKTV